MNKEEKLIIKKLTNGDQVDVNLPIYSSFMMKYYYEYAMVQLAFECYTLYESMTDRDFEQDAFFQEGLQTVLQVIRQELVADTSSGTTHEKSLDALTSLRNSMIKRMELLTAYTDSLQIFEHLHNRMEYEFEEGLAVSSEDIQTTTARMFQYVFADQDKVNINYKIKQFVSELPIRMTSNRFYDLINQSLMIYVGSEKQSLDNFVESIKTTSLLYHPEGFETVYPAYYEFIDYLLHTDYNNMTKELYDINIQKLTTITGEITDIVNMYLSLEEIINHLMTVVLTAPYILADSEASSHANAIISGFVTAMDAKADLAPDLDEHLVSLEGCLEALQLDIGTCETYFEDFFIGYKDMIEALMLRTQFDCIHMVEKLLSSSLFISLEEENDSSDLVDNDYVKQIFEQLTTEYSALFKTLTKRVKRSVMSIVLGSLPVFFNTQQEIKDYFEFSFAQCTSPAELKATIAIMDSIMCE